MLDNLLHNHNLPTVDTDGELTTRRATCAEAERHHAPHVSPALVSDGQGGQKLGIEVVDCTSAEEERQALLTENAAQAETIRRLTAENTAKDEQIANYERLLAQSLPVIFRLGPSLQDVLAEALSHPDMTDDGTAVALKAAQFTLIILNKQERVLVRAVGVNVPERSFPITNGTVTDDDQTTMLGHITRIRRTHETGVDPVNGMIDVVRTVDA